MDIREATLAAKVRAVNNAHAYAEEITEKLTEAFTPLVGQVILKQGGQLMKKFEGIVPKFRNDHNLMVYRHSSEYSLAWTVKTCEQIEGYESCTYYEHTVYIGNLSGNVLESMDNRDKGTLRTDYTVEEIKVKRAEHKRLQNLADAASNALYPFGEVDR